ncbi:MAG TPA: hypothetical protein VFY99_07385, partial [Solirubrobacterales bacterium]
LVRDLERVRKDFEKRANKTRRDAETQARKARRDAEQRVKRAQREAEAQIRKARKQAESTAGRARRQVEGGARRAGRTARDVADPALAQADVLRRRAGAPGGPIALYDQLTVPQIKSRLKDLSKADLRKVRTYEKNNDARKGLLDDLDRRIGDGAKTASTRKRSTARKSTAKKTTARKTTARKSTARKRSS